MSDDTCNVLWSAVCNQLGKKQHQTKEPKRNASLKQQEDSMTVLSSKQQGAPVTTLTKASAVRRFSLFVFSTSQYYSGSSPKQ